MKKLFPIGVIFIITFVFFWQVFIKALLPIPADTIVGLYYPFRDIYGKTNPNGVPFKNFLITDPVRQQIPWKSLAIDMERRLELPLWNPYNMAGTPLLANLQSGVFYPLNFLFFILPFDISWTIFIMLQPILSGFFMYFYLKNLRLNKLSSVMGAVSFSFSGFSIAWFEWGTVLHTALWLPLILLSIDKILINKKRNVLVWNLIFIFSLISSFFAGHTQTFFYLFVFSFAYSVARLIQIKKNLKSLLPFLASSLVFAILTSIQWLPSLKFIELSARSIDLPSFNTPGWFIPWQNLIQFIFPDFFGNPSTLNYWGIWNYAEFIGYIGILPLIMSFFALVFRKDKKMFFFGIAFFLSLIFSLPTFLAKIPFDLKIPLISTSQPTRLLFITDFSLSILAALGLDFFIKLKEKKKILYIIGLFVLIISCTWIFTSYFHNNLIKPEDSQVTRQNLIFPTIIFAFITLILVFITFLNKRLNNKIIIAAFSLLILITIADLFRFGWKFTPFTPKEYFFPSTSVISFLQKQEQPFRIMSADDRILPPNFSIMYGISTIDGYDPLYLKKYGELIAASERGKSDFSPPFGFNRIITPKNYSSQIIDLLNVKYILSLSPIENDKLRKIYSDGSVSVYENKNVMPRVFFVKNVSSFDTDQKTMEYLFDPKILLNESAVVQNEQLSKTNLPIGKAKIISYVENRVKIETENSGEGFLILTDSYYPTWHARIDGKETKIYITDYNFRGIVVPTGSHTIEFYNTIF